ncbi:MAG: multiple sugar transport system substrate-binding protein, partial [Microbacteriaceae bacterium]|nr:multiple sugar transport system substrate-binding protein [Microbacteriaceae bacterium]
MTGNDSERVTTRSEASSLSRRGFLQAGGGLLAAGATAALLGACSSSSSKAATRSGGATGGKTTLKLMSWEQFEVGEKTAWNKVISDFEAANSSVSVSWTGWPFATFDQNVIAQAQAGSIDADVVMCPPELATALITKFGACVPLQSITNELKLTPIPAHEQFKKGSDLEGLGVIDVPFAITYDQKLLQSAGVQPPTSIDEWTSISKSLTHKPDQFGMNLLNSVADGADWWNQLQNFPLAYDGAWASGKTLQFTSQPVVDSMKLWIQL